MSNETSASVDKNERDLKSDLKVNLETFRDMIATKLLEN